MRHRRRTAAWGCPPIPALLSLVPPAAPQRRSRARAPRPSPSIQALGLLCPAALLPPGFHSRAFPCALTRDYPSPLRTSATHFPPATRLFPVILPLPLPGPLAQLRNGVRASPLRGMSIQPITATHSHSLPFSAAAGRARSLERAGPCAPYCGACLSPPPPPALGLVAEGGAGRVGKGDEWRCSEVRSQRMRPGAPRAGFLKT